MFSAKILPFVAVAWTVLVDGGLALDPMPDDVKPWMEKGAQRWADITKALKVTTDQDEAPSDFCQQRNPKYWIQGDTSPPQEAPTKYGQFIQDAGLPISGAEANNYVINIGYPWNGQPGSRNIPTEGDDDSLRYDNYYSPKDNVIAASDLWKGRSNTALQPYSQVTWTMWTQLKHRANDGGQVGDLKSLIHYTCQNPGAKTVADWLCYEEDEGAYVERTLTLSPNTDEFNAVLGIDNGATAKGIVTQHKHALNFKSITSVTVVCDGTQLMGVSYNFG